MDENPYQSPNVDSSDLPEPKHRSFQLTRDASTENAFTVGTFREAVKFNVFLQLPFVLLSAMLLDGGMVFRRFAIATIAFWTLTLIIAIRRRPNFPDSDILLVKWGYLPIVLVTFVAWAVACRIG